MHKKKRAVIFLIVLATLVFISAIFWLILTFAKPQRELPDYGYEFYTPDADADILNEEEYLLLDRSIRYSDGFGTWGIREGDNVLTNDRIQLFLIQYIDALIAGDADALRALYTEEAAFASKLPSSFTRQRIYETVFTEIDRQEKKDGKEEYLFYEIRAEYKIHRNDGTFRRDIDSDAVKALYLDIEYRQDGIHIVDVIPVRRG